MATQQIKDLTEATTVNNDDILLIQDTTDANKKVTKENLLKEINQEQLNINKNIKTITENISNLDESDKTITDIIGTETMGTTATTLKGAIGEHNQQINCMAYFDNIRDMIFNTKANKTINIKIIGDSITAGCGGSDFNCNGETIFGDKKANTGFCWANSFKNYLENKFNCSVKNWGIAGYSSADISSHKSDLIESTDDIIICSVGINDRYFSHTTDILGATAGYLTEVINYVKDLNKKILLVTNIQDSDSNANLFNTKAIDISDTIIKTAYINNIPCINMYNILNNYIDFSGLVLSQILSEDGLHPCDLGYNIMFKIMLEQFKISAPLDKMYKNKWIDLPLNYGEVVTPVQYRLKNGEVEIRGAFKGITTELNNNQSIATLPIVFRPVSNSAFYNLPHVGDSFKSIHLIIGINGDLLLGIPNSTVDDIWILNSIKFSID